NRDHARELRLRHAVPGPQMKEDGPLPDPNAGWPKSIGEFRCHHPRRQVHQIAEAVADDERASGRSPGAGDPGDDGPPPHRSGSVSRTRMKPFTRVIRKRARWIGWKAATASFAAILSGVDTG